MATILKSNRREFREDPNKIDNFRMGEAGAHQLYNHTEEPCVYLDIRTFIGYDVCEYPDSNKIFLVPSYEIFAKDSRKNYFDGEENIRDKWKEIGNKGE
ncbi:MAG: hypothetical protein LBP25_04870 [Tannerellaceae bacterium]|jgi:uncharacterized cupin superfamily protein|nr:hypothetical protein [Tannerellaceae bacterium]